MHGLFNINFGVSAENYCADYLKNNGYKIVARNFRSRFGEIDIIALKGGETVFVEVKARNSVDFGYPEEAVTPRKIEKIRKTIDYFLLINPEYAGKLRIEVFSLLLNKGRVKDLKVIVV